MNQSGQALLNTTKATRQQCSTVFFELLLTNDLTSPSVHLWRRSRDGERVLCVAVGRDAGSSGAATAPMMTAQMIWDSSNSKTTKTKQTKNLAVVEVLLIQSGLPFCMSVTVDL